jgi:hypothetical protein
MQVLPVKKYNLMQELRYDEACKNWRLEQGGFPQAAFYFFSTQQGSFRQTGYVAFGDNRAVWRKTKHEAIKDYRN